jgi:hypothetical protein
MSRFKLGAIVRVRNPQSIFNGRLGIVNTYIWPDAPNPALTIRLLPDDGGPVLPCHEDELEIWPLEEP